jgi:hypothetical protein
MDRGRIIALDTPQRLVDQLVGRGFRKARVERLANLEDVFIDMTGHELREGDWPMRLGVLWALFVASGKMFLRNRAAVFFSLFLPLIIMLIFGVLNFEGSTTVSLGVASYPKHGGTVEERRTALGEIAKASGRKIRYVPISVEENSSMLAEQDVPAEYVWLLTYLFTEVLDGRNAHLADGVQRALGRPPRDFADYARDAAATGIWDSR